MLAEHAAAAAASAAARGARPEAVALGEQALRLTPPGDAAWEQRVLELAGSLESAGERRRVRELLTPVIERLPPGEPRVRAWLYPRGDRRRPPATTFERAARARVRGGRADPALRRRVLAFKALCTAAEGVERIREAEAWALEALPELDALRALAWTRALRGARHRRGLRAVRRGRRAGRAPDRLAGAARGAAARRGAARSRPRARQTTASSKALAAERGESVGYAWLRLNLCEIELRAGEWDAAERLLDEWADSDDGQFLITPDLPALPRAARRRSRRPRTRRIEWAQPALERGRRGASYTWQILGVAPRARRRGAARGRPGDGRGAAAVRARALRARGHRRARRVPGRRRPARGARRAGRPTTRPRRPRAPRRAGPGPSVGAGARSPARTATPAAADGLRARLGLRFDAARTRLAHGRAARRARQWRAARDALEAAAEALRRARLARLGGAGPRRARPRRRSQAAHATRTSSPRPSARSPSWPPRGGPTRRSRTPCS